MNRRNIFVNRGQLSDPDFISGTCQRSNVQFADDIHNWDLVVNYILDG